MNLQPITPSPYASSGSPFTAVCAKCSRRQYSHNMAADLDAPPFTFVCVLCAPESEQDRLRIANGRAFDALTTGQKHHSHVVQFGYAETRAIEARAAGRWS